MKIPSRALAIGGFIAAAPILSAAPVLVPNGNFETAGGAQWGEAGGPSTTFSYPSTGGNPDGYGVMTNDGDGFGVLISNGGDELPLSALGLSAGENYVFSQDMILLAGTDLGGLKLEFYAGGNLVEAPREIFPTPINGGTAWETYLFPTFIPATTETIKFVPLWGRNSSVGFDNIGVDNTPVVLPPGPRIPNGNFETPSGVDWGFFEQGGHSVSYPATGGNPDGFAQIDSSASSGTPNFAGIASNGNSRFAISELGLSAGETYTFSVDMIIISGSNIGKFKVDFFPSAVAAGTSTGDLTPALIGDGSTWETYTFDITLPSDTSHIVLVPLWGADSVVGFDNVDIEVPFTPPFAADIQSGTVLSWVPEDPSSTFFQPQSSQNGVDWVDLGPAIEGQTVTTAFVSEEAPFYQVLELGEAITDANLEGGFETEGGEGPDSAMSWALLGSQPPTRINSDFYEGAAAMRIAVQNDDSGAANNSEVQQNIANVGGTITPGNTYDFSFWAKQVTSGVSYVQNYRVQWLDANSAPLGGGVGFNSFSGGLGTWQEISVTGLVAPDEAVTALIQIFGATGAVPGVDAQGEVLIDNLILGSSETLVIEQLDPTTAPGVEVSWMTEADKTYQVEMSTDLETFTDFGSPITGDGSEWAVGDLLGPDVKLYRVIETP